MLLGSAAVTLIGAHRGASGEAPENTFAAFDLALAQGAELLEFDVHQTADCALVVHHDFDVVRTSGVRGEIGRLSLAELQRCELGSWRGEQWRGQRMPTFEQVLDRYGSQVLLNAEIKVDDTPYPGIEERIAAAVHDRALEARVIVSSFDAATIHRMRAVAPYIHVGVLAEERPAEAIDLAEECGASAVHLAPDLITAARLQQAHALGFGMLAWTVDDPLEMVRLIELGVDAVLSNYPSRLRAVVLPRRCS